MKLKFIKDFDNFLIKEYLQNEDIYLLKYLNMTEDEKLEDLAFEKGYYFINYLNDMELELSNEKLSENDLIIIDEVLNKEIESYEGVEKVSSELKKKFAKWILDGVYDLRIEDDMPTWYYFPDGGNLIKKQWLVHETNEGGEIYRNGFVYGSHDMVNLGLTTRYTQESKKYGGYNFAYTVNDFLKYGNARSDKFKYGDEIILFRSSGVRAFHDGDREYQVIFWGSKAEDIILVQEYQGEYYIESNITGNTLIKIDNIKDLISWVEENYQQYYRHLFSKKKK